MKYFTIPADFKNDTINRYDELNQKYKDSKIIETYGQLAPDTFLGTGRNPKDLPKVDMKTLENYVKHSREKGIHFNYVINGTCMNNEELTKEGYKRIEKFLIMLRNIGIEWLTISLPSIIEIAKDIVPKINIKTSTLSQINSPAKAQYYEKLGIKRIVLDEDVHRRFDILKNIRKVFTGDIEIIVNSFCIQDCPLKMFHFNSYSQSNNEKNPYPYYYTRCMALHLNPENYMKLNWIRPEDIHYYSDIGIQYFKLQGRTNVYNGDPVKSVTHYIEESFDGNLIELLELFSPDKPFTIGGIQLENRRLDGFFEKFVKYPSFCSKLCDSCNYCKSFSEKCVTTTERFIPDQIMENIFLNEFTRELKEE